MISFDIFDDITGKRDKILSRIQAKMIFHQEFEEIKQWAQIERSKFEISGHSNNDDPFLFTKMLEIALESKYRNAPAHKRQILIANALLPNDKEIAQVLSAENIGQNELFDIIRFRDKLQNLLVNNHTLDKETQKKRQEYIRRISRLKKIFESNFGINEPYIILNRICEMLVSHPELFETKHYPKERRLNINREDKN